MSYHGSHSPPVFHFDCAPTHNSPPTQHLGTDQHTPKRRRLEQSDLLDIGLDIHPNMASHDFYDFSFSAPQDYVPHPGSSQGSNISSDFPVIQPQFSASWALEPRWDEAPPRTSTENDEFEKNIRDAVLINDSHSQRVYPPPITHHHHHHHHHRVPSTPAYRYSEDYAWVPPNLPRGTFTIAPPSSSPPRHRPQSHPSLENVKPHLHQMQAPIRGPRTPVRHPTGTVPHPPQNHPPPPPRKGSITLTLTRATTESINTIPEHKQECPACQLEFEPDNYLAIISCCGTAMHATCLSAWVNSATYAKTKVCMKCRKAIDARRPLNNVVPPVTDKSWDEGVDFNAPESVQGDTKIELDVGSRPSSSTYGRFGHVRRAPGYVRRRAPMLTEDDLPVDVRPAFQKLQKEFQKEVDVMKSRHSGVYQEWQAAFDTEIRAAQIAADAKEALAARVGMTQREVDGLVERVREAREVQEVRHMAFRRIVREQEELEKQHQRRITALMEDAMMARRRAAEAQANEAQAAQTHTAQQ